MRINIYLFFFFFDRALVFRLRALATLRTRDYYAKGRRRRRRGRGELHLRTNRQPEQLPVWDSGNCPIPTKTPHPPRPEHAMPVGSVDHSATGRAHVYLFSSASVCPPRHMAPWRDPDREHIRGSMRLSRASVFLLCSCNTTIAV
jgi:hypothetical protein